MTIFLVEQNANQALKLADRGYVLENGHVAEQGTPAELMERGGLYRRMVELQSESARWKLNGTEA